jgi:hypothetical protein
MEYVLVGGIALLVYNIYQKVVKPIEDAERFVNKNIIEPINEKFIEPIHDTAQKAFGDVKEGAEKTGDFLGEMGQITYEGDKARAESLLGGVVAGGKNIKPIAEEVPHAFKDAIDEVKEQGADVPALGSKGLNDVKKGNLLEGGIELNHSGVVAGKAAGKGVDKGIADVKKKTDKAGQDVGKHLKKGAEATKKQAEDTGRGIARFMGF